MLGLSALWTRRTDRPTPPPPASRYSFRPRLEGFEDRIVPAAPLLRAVPGAVAAPSPQLNLSPTFNFNALQLNVSNVQILSNNTLGAVFQIGNVTQIVPITLGTTPNPQNADCPILNLELGPIHLDLLGLNVDTSEICLDITAHQGEGLLGDLLCGVANLLNGGTPLGNILGGLTNINVGNLLNGLTQVLDGVFGGLGNVNVAGVSNSPAGRCDILNLEVGPLDLNLLGLQVELDNCHNGPVTVDITAEPGPGRLLGNLLCGLANLLNGPANASALGAAGRMVDRIEGLIGGIVNAN